MFHTFLVFPKAERPTKPNRTEPSTSELFFFAMASFDEIDLGVQEDHVCLVDPTGSKVKTEELRFFVKIYCSAVCSKYFARAIKNDLKSSHGVVSSKLASFLLYGCSNPTPNRDFDNLDYEQIYRECVDHCEGEREGKTFVAVDWSPLNDNLVGDYEFQETYLSLPFGLHSMLTHLSSGHLQEGEMWVWPEAGPQVSNPTSFESLYNLKDGNGKYQKILEENRMFCSCITPYKVHSSRDGDTDITDGIKVGPNVIANVAGSGALYRSERNVLVHRAPTGDDLNDLCVMLVVSCVLSSSCIFSRTVGVVDEMRSFGHFPPPPRETSYTDFLCFLCSFHRGRECLSRRIFRASRAIFLVSSTRSSWISSTANSSRSCIKLNLGLGYTEYLCTGRWVTTS